MDRASIKQLDIKTRKIFEVLLKESQPTRDRKYALVRLLMQEGSSLSREKLDEAVSSFYKLNYERRTAKQFRRTFAVKPYPWLLNQFNLSFRSAFVSETTVFKTASTIRHLIRNIIATPDEVASVDLIHLVVHRLTKPRIDQAASSISFQTFCYRWRDVSFFKFGSRYEKFFDDLDEAVEDAENTDVDADAGFFSLSDESSDEVYSDPEITQTDLDWFKDLLSAFEGNQRPPLYPLHRGPQTPILLRIEKLVRAAHLIFPVRHGQLEEAVTRGCLYYLKHFKQEPQGDRQAA